jgi:hypothetical protein
VQLICNWTPDESVGVPKTLAVDLEIPTENKRQIRQQVRVPKTTDYDTI